VDRLCDAARGLAIAVVTVLAVLVSGCGGSRRAQATQAVVVGPARQSVIARGDRICAAGDRQLRTIDREITALNRTSDPTRRAKIVALLGQSAAITQTRANRLGALHPPAEARVDVLGYRDAVIEEARVIHRIEVGLAHRHDAAAGPLARQLGQLQQQAHALAQRYGFKVCGIRG
jgi:hypothetical protein